VLRGTHNLDDSLLTRRLTCSLDSVPIPLSGVHHSSFSLCSSWQALPILAFVFILLTMDETRLHLCMVLYSRILHRRRICQHCRLCSTSVVCRSLRGPKRTLISGILSNWSAYILSSIMDEVICRLPAVQERQNSKEEEGAPLNSGYAILLFRPKPIPTKLLCAIIHVLNHSYSLLS
jgi:hypothetical protein